MASERAAQDASNLAAQKDIEEKMERLRRMSVAFAEQTAEAEATVARCDEEMNAARDAARLANERADRVEGEAAAIRAEAAEQSAIARAAVEDATRERETLLERAHELERASACQAAVDAIKEESLW